ncbi:MAG: cytochrome-c oxidase, cbb3-type subunit III [Magnetococcales bacterium]|nr:cytochrome-c oxidase, cbb3-type subunit III [Magnetococcales bacterium]
MADKQVETTGHQWDDEEGFPLQEFNNPLPRWWLYSFYATILFAVIYWILYPAWPIPGGFTKGVLGWSQYQELQKEMTDAQSARKVFDDRLSAASLEEIAANPQLLAYAKAGGRALFANQCAGCHGTEGSGTTQGFPILVDDDWLYGGTLQEIYATIANGRSGTMPPHLQAAGGAFSEAQVNDLADFVLTLSNRPADKAAAERGKALFMGDAGCHLCHGDHGRGSVLDTLGGQPLDHNTGAPNLTDGIWLHGGDRATIVQTIARGRASKMPAWGVDSGESLGRNLGPLAVKQLALYVHGLGGGK